MLRTGAKPVVVSYIYGESRPLCARGGLRRKPPWTSRGTVLTPVRGSASSLSVGHGLDWHGVCAVSNRRTRRPRRGGRRLERAVNGGGSGRVEGWVSTE
jgi:hypothetical protein